MLGRMLPGHLFDTGLTANRSLSLAQNYVLALLITPFDVVETLRELQFQPRFEVIKREIGTKTHTWFGKKESNYIPLLHRGTWESVREIVEFPKGGAIVLIRGNQSLTFCLQPGISGLLSHCPDIAELTNLIKTDRALHEVDLQIPVHADSGLLRGDSQRNFQYLQADRYLDLLP